MQKTAYYGQSARTKPQFAHVSGSFRSYSEVKLRNTDSLNLVKFLQEKLASKKRCLAVKD